MKAQPRWVLCFIIAFVLTLQLGWAQSPAADYSMRMSDSTPTALPGVPVGGVVIFTPANGGARNKADEATNRLVTALESSGLRVSRVKLPPKASNGAVSKLVRSAIARLSSQCGENGDRIAVVAEREAADAAVLGARAEWKVRSFVLLSGRLGQKAKALLAEWRDNPTLCLVSSEDKAALRDLTEVYFASKHADSDIKVYEDAGRGTEMLRSQEPMTIAEWLRRGLSSVGRAREVSFMTEDGWQIFGNLLLPDPGGRSAPGVILLHSGRSDRFVFAGMERRLIGAGFALLNIDWRGRGKSVNKGRYFDLSKQERFNGLYDAKAAIDYLAAQPGVDRDRIGMVGVIHGAEHAVRASIGDARVKSLALLTGYMPVDERERAYLTSGDVHVMYVSSTGHKQVTEAMRRLYEATPDKLTRLLIFEGGAIGYQLFELDEKFEPMIVEWLKEGLMK